MATLAIRVHVGSPLGTRAPMHALVRRAGAAVRPGTASSRVMIDALDPAAAEPPYHDEAPVEAAGAGSLLHRSRA